MLCLFIGYPFAYFIARAKKSIQPALLMLVIIAVLDLVPAACLCLEGILADQGVVNNALLWLGVIQEPLQLLYSDVSMLVGMTYVYCPFMILPLYATWRRWIFACSKRRTIWAPAHGMLFGW